MKSEELQQRLDDLQAARDRITGTIRDASGNNNQVEQVKLLQY